MLVMPQDWLVREADKGAPLSMATCRFELPKLVSPREVQPLRRRYTACISFLLCLIYIYIYMYVCVYIYIFFFVAPPNRKGGQQLASAHRARGLLAMALLGSQSSIIQARPSRPQTKKRFLVPDPAQPAQACYEMLLNVLQIGQGILDCKQEQERRFMVQQLLVSIEAYDSSRRGFPCLSI